MNKTTQQDFEKAREITPDIHSAKFDIERLESEKSLLEKSVEVSDNAFADACRKLLKSTERIKALEAERDELQNGLSVRNDEVTGLLGMNFELKTENSLLKTENERLKAEKDKVWDELMEYQKEVRRLKMADGKGCVCAAYSSSECGCDADWTPQIVYDLRSENKKLKEMLDWFFSRPYQVVDGVIDMQVGEMHLMNKPYQQYKKDFYSPTTSKTLEIQRAKDKVIYCVEENFAGINLPSQNSIDEKYYYLVARIKDVRDKWVALKALDALTEEEEGKA